MTTLVSNNKHIFYSIVFLFLALSLTYFTVKFWNVPAEFVPSSAFDVIPNVVKGNGYYGNLPGYDFNFYTHRFPVQVFIPALLINIFPHNLGLIFFFKNLIFAALLLYSVMRVVKNREVFSNNSLLTLALVFLNPYFILTFSTIAVEEAYSITFFSLIFSFFVFKEADLNRNKLIMFALFMFLFALLKSSYLLLAGIIPILFWQRYKDKRLIIYGTTGVILAFILWGGWVYYSTSKVSLSSSYNWFNFFKGNSEYSDAYYIGDLDKIPNQFLYGDFEDEWEWSDAYKEASLNFVYNNPLVIAKLFLKKVFVFFLNIVPVTADSVYKILIYGLTLLLLRLVFYLNVMQFVRTSVKRKPAQHDKFLLVALVLIVIFYSVPYLIGFAYIRHFLPLSILAVFLSLKSQENKLMYSS